MRREGTVTVFRAGVIDDGIVTLRRLLVAGAAGRPGRPPLLCSFERLLCSRLRFEQLAPYVEERPTDEHGGPEEDESSNDGYRDRYAGKLRDEAYAFTTNVTHGHGGLLKRQPAYLKAARQGKAPPGRDGSVVQPEALNGRKHFEVCFTVQVTVRDFSSRITMAVARLVGEKIEAAVTIAVL